jgi:hypothetical protein
MQINIEIKPGSDEPRSNQPKVERQDSLSPFCRRTGSTP